MEEVTEQAIHAAIVSISTKLLRSVYATLCVIIAVTVGATAWVTRVNDQLEVISATIVKLEGKMPPLWVRNSIGRLEEEQMRMRDRIGELEE